MEGASTSVYRFDTVVRGQYMYKDAWTPLSASCGKAINVISML